MVLISNLLIQADNQKTLLTELSAGEIISTMH